MSSELKQLRTLIAAADCGSFSAAAAKLHVEVSAVSRSVRDVEETIGAPVFDRLPRGIVLTEIGKAYVASAREIVAGADRALVAARAMANGTEGKLTIGYGWSLTQGPGNELISAFRSAAPKIGISLRDGPSEPLLDQLRHGELDLVLTASLHHDRPMQLDSGRVGTHRLWRERILAAVPAMDGVECLSWDEVAGHILLSRRGDAAQEYADHLASLGLPALRFEQIDASSESLLAMVSAGVGWTLVPEEAVRSNIAGIRFVTIEGPCTTIQIIAVWLSEHRDPTLARFLDIARQMFPAETDGMA